MEVFVVDGAPEGNVNSEGAKVPGHLGTIAVKSQDIPGLFLQGTRRPGTKGQSCPGTSRAQA